MELFGEMAAISKEDREEYSSICKNYVELQQEIMHLDFYQLFECMIVEKEGKNRVNILTRLYSRYSELRKAKERRELLS